MKRVRLTISVVSGLTVLCSQAAAQVDQAPQAKVLQLEEALATAKKHAPEIRLAAAQARAARARVGTARSPLFPQLTGTATYSRGSFSSGTGGGGLDPSSGNNTVREGFSFGLRATQLLWDFGQAYYALEAAADNAEAQEHTQHAQDLLIAFNVRSAFLSAAANHALVDVAKATLGNQERHLGQIQGFVDVGTRPPIDLAQSRTDVANAKLALIRAENNYASAKAQLSRAMGTPDQVAFDVSDALPPPEESENAGLEELVRLAEKARPELAALQSQIDAQRATRKSIRGQYGPTLNAVGSVSETGIALDDLRSGYNLGLNLTWPIFQGGLTNSRMSEANAVVTQLEAQLETQRQDLRVALTQADLAIKAAQAALIAADELVSLAKERVTLAEGRYETGVGNTIELGDAELALRDAQTQHVSAQYDLATARATLHRTLGRL